MRSCLAGSHARGVLQDGDFLLTVAGRAVSHFQAAEAAVAASGTGKAAQPSASAAAVSIPGVASSGDLGETTSEVGLPSSRVYCDSIAMTEWPLEWLQGFGSCHMLYMTLRSENWSRFNMAKQICLCSQW